MDGLRVPAWIGHPHVDVEVSRLEDLAKIFGTKDGGWISFSER